MQLSEDVCRSGVAVPVEAVTTCTLLIWENLVPLSGLREVYMITLHSVDHGRPGPASRRCCHGTDGCARVLNVSSSANLNSVRS